MDPRDSERIGRIDSTFRDANEQILAKAHELAYDDGLVPFICECADEECATIVPLAPEEYEQVRVDSRHFLNALGHERAEGLVEIVLTNHNHLVVRKSGPAADIAQTLDGRRRRNGGG